jgi:hypothetical protein
MKPWTTTKELIERLKEVDPSGNARVFRFNTEDDGDGTYAVDEVRRMPTGEVVIE